MTPPPTVSSTLSNAFGSDAALVGSSQYAFTRAAGHEAGTSYWRTPPVGSIALSGVSVGPPLAAAWIRIANGQLLMTLRHGGFAHAEPTGSGGLLLLSGGEARSTMPPSPSGATDRSATAPSSPVAMVALPQPAAAATTTTSVRRSRVLMKPANRG